MFRNLVIFMLLSLAATASCLVVQGSGSVGSYPVFRDITSSYNALEAKYQLNFTSVIGLSETALLKAGYVDYAISEAFPNEQEIVELFAVPLVGGPIIVAYNLDLGRTLIIDGETLAQIFQRKIAWWDDPALKALNPTIELPRLPIVLVYDYTPSGTTRVFTSALSLFSSEWNETVGVVDTLVAALDPSSDEFQIPVVASSLVQSLRSRKGTLTYMTLPEFFGADGTTTYFHMINKQGKIVYVNPTSVAGSMQLASFDETLQGTAVDSDVSFAWPITGISYLIVRNNMDGKCEELKEIFSWAYWSISSYLGHTLTLKHLSQTIDEGTTDEVLNFMEAYLCDGEQIFFRTDPLRISAVVQPDYKDMSSYSPTPVEGLSPFWNDIGSPTSQISPYQFPSIDTSANLKDGLMVSTEDLTPGESSPASSLKVNSSSSLWLVLFAVFITTFVAGFSSPDATSQEQKRRNSSSSFGLSAPALIVVLGLVFCVGFLPSTVMAAQIDIVGLFPLTGANANSGGQEEAAARIAVEAINNRSMEEGFLLNNTLRLITLDTQSTEPGALALMTNIPETNVLITSDDVVTVRAIAPVIEQLELFHITSTSSSILSALGLRYFVQITPNDKYQGIAIADLVYRMNWAWTVAAFSSSDAYGSTILNSFHNRAESLDFNLLASQQFAAGAEDLWEIVQVVKESRARCIVNFMSSDDMRNVLRHADRLGLIGDNFVWICSDACASVSLFTEDDGTLDVSKRKRVHGMLGIRKLGGTGKRYEEFLDDWETRDPKFYAGAGHRAITLNAPYVYDSITAWAEYLNLLLQVPNPSLDKAENFAEAVEFMGLTGWIDLDYQLQRRPVFAIVNLQDVDYKDLKTTTYLDFSPVGVWNNSLASSKHGKIEFQYNIQYHDGTTNPPDLDVRNPFKYWSCPDSEEKTDETGKTVRLDAPDGPGAENIAHYYRCDEYIDCYNLSDEWGCSVSLPIAFIVYGIVLALLILFSLFCLIVTILFGCIFRFRRIRAASPTFLIIMILAALLGYTGLFSFYGQPQAVACGFQIWIVALSIFVMISALFAKSFRIWRLYRSPTAINAMRDWQLVIFVGITVIPMLVLLILWTALSTPGASLIKQDDKHEHYVCYMGGVAGNEGAYTFFALIVAYIAAFLLFGTFLSFVTRNVVSTFNESRLIAVSIYNLVFLGIVIIPIYFVLEGNGPVVQWVIIVTAVIYGLSATMFLQFVPKIWGIIITDRLSDHSEASTSKMESTGKGELNSGNSGVADSKAIW